MMFKAALAATFAVLMTASLPASAATLSLQYDGPTTTSPEKIKITQSPRTPAVGLNTSIGAYGFNMTDTSGQLGSFVAWCLDITHKLSTTGSKPYEITETPFASSWGATGWLGRVQAIFDANYATLDVTNGRQAAGFQLALWNAVYDSDWSITNGAFKATASSSVLSLANGFLAAASTFSGESLWDLTYLESQGVKESKHGPTVRYQNLVTANLIPPAAVPVPAAGLLLLGALGGLALVRRRRTEG